MQITLCAYYNFENHHFDRTMETLLTVIAEKFLNSVSTPYSVIFPKKKHIHKTKKLSFFFFSRRGAINTIHSLYVVEETPKRDE